MTACWIDAYGLCSPVRGKPSEAPPVKLKSSGSPLKGDSDIFYSKHSIDNRLFTPLLAGGG